MSDDGRTPTFDEACSEFEFAVRDFMITLACKLRIPALLDWIVRVLQRAA